jgi:hypothetical protein
LASTIAINKQLRGYKQLLALTPSIIISQLNSSLAVQLLRILSYTQSHQGHVDHASRRLAAAFNNSIQFLIPILSFPLLNRPSRKVTTTTQLLVLPSSHPSGTGSFIGFCNCQLHQFDTMSSDAGPVAGDAAITGQSETVPSKGGKFHPPLASAPSQYDSEINVSYSL